MGCGGICNCVTHFGWKTWTFWLENLSLGTWRCGAEGRTLMSAAARTSRHGAIETSALSFHFNIHFIIECMMVMVRIFFINTLISVMHARGTTWSSTGIFIVAFIEKQSYNRLS